MLEMNQLPMKLEFRQQDLDFSESELFEATGSADLLEIRVKNVEVDSEHPANRTGKNVICEAALLRFEDVVGSKRNMVPYTPELEDRFKLGPSREQIDIPLPESVASSPTDSGYSTFFLEGKIIKDGAQFLVDCWEIVCKQASLEIVDQRRT